MNKLIVNLSLIVSIDTFICVFRLSGYCRNTCSGDYEYDGRELRDGKCGHSACNCALQITSVASSMNSDGGSRTIGIGGSCCADSEGMCSSGSDAQSITSVTSNQSWVTNLKGTMSGYGVVITADISANTSTSSRSATVTVRNSCGASKTISVTQAEAVVCTLTALPITATFPAMMSIGQEKQINVTSSTGEFEIEESSSWIVISDKTSSGFKIGVTVNRGSARSELINVTNSCGERKTINVKQEAGETPSLTGSLYCTVQLVASNCCNVSNPISFSGTYSLNGGARKVTGIQPIGNRFLLESGLAEGSYTVDLRVTSVQCDGASLATSLNPVEGNDRVTVESGASIGNEATAYFNLNTTCS